MSPASLSGCRGRWPRLSPAEDCWGHGGGARLGETLALLLREVTRLLVKGGGLLLSSFPQTTPPARRPIRLWWPPPTAMREAVSKEPFRFPELSTRLAFLLGLADEPIHPLRPFQGSICIFLGTGTACWILSGQANYNKPEDC